MTGDPSKDREARRAAARAAVAARPAFGPVQTVTVADIRPGDFVGTVPTQERIRGARFDCTVTAVETRWGHYHYSGRGGAEVPAVALTPAVGKVAVIYPAHFRCTVRKPQTQGEQQ